MQGFPRLQSRLKIRCDFCPPGSQSGSHVKLSGMKSRKKSFRQGLQKFREVGKFVVRGSIRGRPLSGEVGLSLGFGGQVGLNRRKDAPC